MIAVRLLNVARWVTYLPGFHGRARAAMEERAAQIQAGSSIAEEEMRIVEKAIRDSGALEDAGRIINAFVHFRCDILWSDLFAMNR